jgi:glycerol-3-phosphate acyltransferase PlsY
VWLYPEQTPFIIFSVAASALVLWRHRSNIARLASGKESKLQFRRGGTFRGRGGA